MIQILLSAVVVVMSFSSDLLTAGFSAVLGKKVMTQMQFEEFKKTPEGRNAVSKKLTIDETFQATYQRSDDEAIRTCQWRYQMFIHTPSGRQVSVFIYHCSTIADLKRVIARRLDIPAEEIRLTFRSQELRDNNKTIGDYNITDNSNITVLLRVRGGGPTEVYIFDESMRDSGFDYDFSSVPDDGQTYYRGPHQYFRPYGWMRFALKVRGKYRNDDWLGAAGMRTNTTSGEWSVSYHGTKRENADSIGRGGYDLRKGKRFLHGKGIYSSPSIHVASGDLYAEEFSHKGNSYKL